MGINDCARVCVTGGAGFIGVRVVDRLLARGVEVTVLDDLSVGRRERLASGARLIVGDIRDAGAVREAMSDADAVIHLAARVAVRSSFEYAPEDASVNLVGTANVLRGAIDAGTVERFVFASSMAVYADSPGPQPIDESHPTVPASPYGVSKLAAERLVHLMCSHSGLSSTVLRLFNTYGPGQSVSPYVGVVTIFITRLKNGGQPEIYGDGEQCRDFVHVDDVANALVLAMEVERSGGTYNVGTGKATSVNEIYERIRRAMGTGTSARHVAQAAGELRYSIANVAAARSGLGYRPARTLDEDFEPVVAELCEVSGARDVGSAR